MKPDSVNREPLTVNRTCPAKRAPLLRLVRFAVHSSLFTLFVLACRATTARPTFTPLPTATSAEVELDIPAATRALAEALATDSIALASIKENDGYIDSGWLDAATLEHTTRRPVGSAVVRVRAWVNPAREFWSELVVEAAYRPMVDPSRPDRELEVPLPTDHPLQRRIAGTLRRLIEKYGDPETLKALAPPKPAKPDTTKGKKDSTAVKKDTTKAKPKRDTIPDGSYWSLPPVTLHRLSPTPPAEPGRRAYPGTVRSAE